MPQALRKSYINTGSPNVEYYACIACPKNEFRAGKILEEWVSTKRIRDCAEIESRRKNNSNSASETIVPDWASLLMAWMLGAELKDEKFQSAIIEQLTTKFVLDKQNVTDFLAALSSAMIKRIYSNAKTDALQEFLEKTVVKRGDVQSVSRFGLHDFEGEFVVGLLRRFVHIRDGVLDILSQGG